LVGNPLIGSIPIGAVGAVVIFLTRPNLADYMATQLMCVVCVVYVTHKNEPKMNVVLSSIAHIAHLIAT
jgi:hypothetical protein